MDKKELTLWLTNSVTEAKNGRYRHRLLKEDRNQRDHALESLQAYVQKAHEDARRRLRKLADFPLDPLGDFQELDAAEGYPERLHVQTLKGYFGEVFAGLIAQTLSPCAIDGWAVPAFLFRFHLTEFQHLEELLQIDEESKEGEESEEKRVGRTGDDCLAFHLDAEDQVDRVLYCEAKCVVRHRVDTIAAAHSRVSRPFLVDVLQLIEILLDYDDLQSSLWVDALRRFYLTVRKRSRGYERCDLVSYVCGQCPKDEPTWMDRQKPHPNYTAERRLEAVETHLEDLEHLVRLVYGKEEAGDGRVP